MIATEPRVLQCGVVGAGVAGLGAAIALSNAGHDVEIFERSQFKQEVGAAITMTPNAGLILDHWGFDQEAAQPTDLMQFRLIDSETLALINCNPFEEVLDKYHHRMASYHRVDLHGGIRLLAAQHSSISIKLGAGVTKLDCDTGTLGFADGSYIGKDLVVVADGTKVSLGLCIAFSLPPTWSLVHSYDGSFTSTINHLTQLWLTLL